jgi:hypothetical protein
MASGSSAPELNEFRWLKSGTAPNQEESGRCGRDPVTESGLGEWWVGERAAESRRFKRSGQDCAPEQWLARRFGRDYAAGLRRTVLRDRRDARAQRQLGLLASRCVRASARSSCRARRREPAQAPTYGSGPAHAPEPCLARHSGSDPATESRRALRRDRRDARAQRQPRRSASRCARASGRSLWPARRREPSQSRTYRPGPDCARPPRRYSPFGEGSCAHAMGGPPVGESR